MRREATVAFLDNDSLYKTVLASIMKTVVLNHTQKLYLQDDQATLQYLYYLSCNTN